MCRFFRPKKQIYAASDFPLVYSPGRWYMRAKTETSGCVYAFVRVCVQCELSLSVCSMCVWVREREKKRQTAALGVNMMLLVLHTQTTRWPTFYPIPHTPLCAQMHACTHTLTLLCLVISVFCPPSILPSISNTSSFLLHSPLLTPSLITHTHTQDMLTLGYGAVVVYRGKYARAKGWLWGEWIHLTELTRPVWPYWLIGWPDSWSRADWLGGQVEGGSVGQWTTCQWCASQSSHILRSLVCQEVKFARTSHDPTKFLARLTMIKITRRDIND